MDHSIKRREFPRLPPEQAKAIREHYRKATEPYSGRTFVIESTPEQIEKVRREVENGCIPF